MSLTLYYHPLSSYCQKVLIALYEQQIPFDKRAINLGDAEERAELLAAWPLGKFPVLRDTAVPRDVPESSVIIEYLELLPGAATSLVPAERAEALDTRLWDRFVDNYVHTPLQRIVGDRIMGAGADLSREHATLDTAYGVLDQQLAKGAWLAGAAFSLSDCAAAPALFYARAVHPFPKDAPALTGYFERLVVRPSVARVLAESRPYFEMFPFADQLETRFR